MSKSLFDVLHAEGLTRLTIHYDFRTEKSHLFSARTWDDRVRWSTYNQSFTAATPLTDDEVFHNSADTRALIKRAGASGHLDDVINLMRKGRHRFIDCFYCRPRNIRFISSVHSDVMGLNNRSHAIRAGGIRRHDLGASELDVIVDGLNLSRGMSFKNFAARIPYGGNKMTVMMDPLRLDDLESLGFIAYCLDHSRSFTGPDMGFPIELADALKRHFTINATGGPSGPLGATGTPTAYGTYLAVKEAARFAFGSAELGRCKIAVQGLGAVGFPLCEHYIREAARLYVADIDPRPIDWLKRLHPGAAIEVVDPARILSIDADIFSPCAVGGVITAENIPSLKFRIILGGANNQLKASSQDEEIVLARLLDKQRVLFQVDWWHNLGGVLCGCEEYEKQDKASMDGVRARLSELCPASTRQNLTEARDRHVTPTENAYTRAEAAIYA